MNRMSQSRVKRRGFFAVVAGLVVAPLGVLCGAGSGKAQTSQLVEGELPFEPPASCQFPIYRFDSQGSDTAETVAIYARDPKTGKWRPLRLARANRTASAIGSREPDSVDFECATWLYEQYRIAVDEETESCEDLGTKRGRSG